MYLWAISAEVDGLKGMMVSTSENFALMIKLGWLQFRNYAVVGQLRWLGQLTLLTELDGNLQTQR
jgi:hypothetical protein